MLEYRTCCIKNAREDARFRCCPICSQDLLRCPACKGLITPLGACTTCLDLSVEVPHGLVIKEGEAVDIPLDIFNRGTAPLQLLLASCRSGASLTHADVAGLSVAPGQSLEVQVHIPYAQAGHFNLELQLEVEWAHAARLGFRGLSTGAVEVRPRRDGPLISAHSEGTGNLVNVSGLSTELLSEALRSQGPSSSRKATLRLCPLPAEALANFGDKSGIVSWATSLELPDMLSGAGVATASPRPWTGLVLGRDRPPAPPSKDPAHSGTDLALRFPANHAHGRQLTMSISRRHWRLYPWSGTWWLEQLGASPTTVLAPGQQRQVLSKGDRTPLPSGSRIFALGGQHERLGLRLTHAHHKGRAVLRSLLTPC